MTPPGPIKVAAIALGAVGDDTGGRSYLAGVLGPLAESPGIELELHLADEDFDPPAGCRVVRHRMPRFGTVGRIAAEARVARSLRGFDVLLAPLNFVPHLWRGRAVVVEHNLLALPSGSPYVTRRKAWYRIRALRSSLRRAQRVVAVSEYLRDRILAELPDSDPAKFVVIPLGLPADWAQHAAAAKTENRVLVVASLSTYKRIDLAIDAFALAAGSLPGTELAIAGPGREDRRRRFEALATERGIGDRVTFLGNVPYGRMAELYGTASVVLNLSTIESFPLPVLEAMGAGVPIVATRIDAAVEVGGDAPVWLEPSADAAEIAEVLERAMTDEQLRAEAIRRGRERAAGLTWERSAELLADTLRDACAVVRAPDPLARPQVGRP